MKPLLELPILSVNVNFLPKLPESRHGLVIDVAVLGGYQLDVKIFKVFSNLKDSEIHPQQDRSAVVLQAREQDEFFTTVLVTVLEERSL